jgi:hypothetical protein
MWCTKCNTLHKRFQTENIVSSCLTRLCNKQCGAQFPGRARDIFVSKISKSGSGGYSVSNSMGNGGVSFHRGKAARGCEADTSPPPSARVKHKNSSILPMLYDNFTLTSEILFLKRVYVHWKSNWAVPPSPTLCGPCSTQRQAQGLISDPDLATRARLLSFNRTQSRVVIGLLTGH